MLDDPNKSGNDQKLISLEHLYEIRLWTESFGVTEEQLRAAVDAVGRSVEEVREYLRKPAGR